MKNIEKMILYLIGMIASFPYIEVELNNDRIFIMIIFLIFFIFCSIQYIKYVYLVIKKAIENLK